MNRQQISAIIYAAATVIAAALAVLYLVTAHTILGVIALAVAILLLVSCGIQLGSARRRT